MGVPRGHEAKQQRRKQPEHWTPMQWIARVAGIEHEICLCRHYTGVVRGSFMSIVNYLFL